MDCFPFAIIECDNDIFDSNNEKQQELVSIFKNKLYFCGRLGINIQHEDKDSPFGDH